MSGSLKGSNIKFTRKKWLWLMENYLKKYKSEWEI